MSRLLDRARITATITLGLTLAGAARGGEEVEPAVHVMAGGTPIDVERSGHAAPFFGDFDGDGLGDLFVGQYDDGALRIYRNVGSRGAPKFAGYEWFQAEGELGRVPAS